MTEHKKSEWFDGLLFAEYVHNQGWTLVCVNDGKECAAWKWKDTDGVQMVFGSERWRDGVRDYYKNLREVEID